MGRLTFSSALVLCKELGIDPATVKLLGNGMIAVDGVVFGPETSTGHAWRELKFKGKKGLVKE